MSLKDKVKKFFSKKESANLLSISLRQKSISLCYIKKGKSPDYHDLLLVDGSYAKTLASISEELNISANTVLILPSQMSQNVQVLKPAVSEEEVNSALKWQIKDLVPVPPEDMLIDYYDAPKLVGVDEKVNVVCAPRGEVKAMVTSLINERISLKKIIIEEFAFASLVTNKDEASLLVCQQPNEEIIIIVVKQGKLYFNRRLRGFSQLSQKSQEDLEMGIVDSISLEIQRSTDYFERQLKQASIKSIEVLVPIKNEAFLARKLSENTNVPVNLLPLPKGFEEYRQYAAVIGANIDNSMSDNRDIKSASAVNEESTNG